MTTALLGAALLSAPAIGHAQPTGSADTGSGVLDGGSSAAEGCVANLEGCIGGLVNSGSSALDTGSGILGSGSAAGPGTGPGTGGGTQACNASTKSGGAGVTSTTHLLGRPGPLSFRLVYDTENIPDEIEVFYEGRRIHTTGRIGDDINEGNGAAMIAVPPGAATSVVVRVTGPNQTHWTYQVNCP